MEDCPSENRSPSQSQPPPESPPPKPCRGITIERSHPAGCSTKSKADKKNLKSFSSNECPTTASSKPKLEESAKIKPPPPPPLSKPTTPAAVKPIPELPPSNTQRCSCPTRSTVKLQSVVAAHKETVATLKCAMRDLFCRAISSTHKAFTNVSNESNKQLQNLKQTASGLVPERKEKEKCDCPAEVKKVSDIPSDANLSRFRVVNVDTSKDISKTPHSKSKSNINEQINKAWNFVLQKVDSAASVLGDTLCSMQRKSFNDQSSKYDVPKPRAKKVSAVTDEEDEEEDILCHPGKFHLFSSMKDKMWGFVSEDDNTIPSSRRSSTATEASESDDDIMNTTIN